MKKAGETVNPGSSPPITDPVWSAKKTREPQSVKEKPGAPKPQGMITKNAENNVKVGVEQEKANSDSGKKLWVQSSYGGAATGVLKRKGE